MIGTSRVDCNSNAGCVEQGAGWRGRDWVGQLLMNSKVLVLITPARKLLNRGRLCFSITAEK